MIYYRITALIVCYFAWKVVQILGFLAPVCFRGRLTEIGIVKFLLGTKRRRVGKFQDVGFPTSEKVRWEKNR